MGKVKTIEVRLETDQVLRLLDVNLNRAAEGLRTLEDIARVVRQDSAAAGWLKSLRHELTVLAEQIPRMPRLAARSVQSDAGTSLSSPSECQREEWSDLVVAAAERTTQSLRVVEEACKSEFPEQSVAAKQLRYLAYDRLAQVEQRLSGACRKFVAQPLYLLVDCHLPVEEFANKLSRLQQAGVGLFQIRDKLADTRRLLAYSQAAVQALGAENVIVNDRVDVALASGAGGVHVGQEDLAIQDVQRLSKGKLAIGVSTHSIRQAIDAQLAGADYIGCGPTFPSETKSFQQFAGVDWLQQVASQIDIPAYAIGGITTANVSRVLETGIRRVAVGAAIWTADAPEEQARRLADQLG